MVATKNITDLNELVSPQADDLMLIVDRLSPTSTEAKKISWASIQESVQDLVAALLQDDPGGTISITYDDANGSLTAGVITDTTVQRIDISSQGAIVGSRRALNFVNSATVEAQVSEEAGQNRVNVSFRNLGLFNTANNSVAGTSYGIYSSLTTNPDGTKTAFLRPLKLGSNKLSASITDSGNSITLDLASPNININDFGPTPLSVTKGGTGGTTPADARAGIAAAKSGVNSDLTELTGLTVPLSLNQGGTGGDTAQSSLYNLEGISYATHVGVAGLSLIANGKSPAAGEYRVELKGIRAASNKVAIGSVSNDITVDVNANNVLNGASANVSLNGYRITNLAEPQAANDAATKAYADSVAQGLNVKQACRVATTANITGTYYNLRATVTAVDTGSESLTIFNHGFTTGERVFVTSSAVLPGGLTEGTTYFAINNGVNSLKLAVTKQDALAGTAVNILSSGSGTIEVYHTLYLEAGANGTISIDGVTLEEGDRILVKNQSVGSQNGIYEVTVPGGLNERALITRAPDGNSDAELSAGSFTFVLEGVTNNNIAYVQTTQNFVLDASSANWSIFSASQVVANSITNDKFVQVNEATIKGRGAGLGSGNVQDLSANDVVAILNTATVYLDCGSY